MFRLLNALLEGAANGVHAGFVAFFLDGGQRQFQRGGGNQAMLLGHGIDRQRQEVEQLVVAKGAQLQLARVGRARLQGVEHPCSST
jgi:hypothetical protein